MRVQGEEPTAKGPQPIRNKCPPDDPGIVQRQRYLGGGQESAIEVSEWRRHGTGGVKTSIGLIERSHCPAYQASGSLHLVDRGRIVGRHRPFAIAV